MPLGYSKPWELLGINPPSLPNAPSSLSTLLPQTAYPKSLQELSLAASTLLRLHISSPFISQNQGFARMEISSLLSLPSSAADQESRVEAAGSEESAGFGACVLHEPEPGLTPSSTGSSEHHWMAQVALSTLVA